MLPAPSSLVLKASLRDVMQHMPLYERLHALAEIMGERLRPAQYAVLGDSGAVAQNVNLDPQANEGPFILHDWRIPSTNTAASITVDLVCNGINYLRNVRADGLPSTLNSPIVIEESNRARFKLTAGTGAHSQIAASFSGVHCSPSFGKLVRSLGEFWAEQVVFAVNDPPKALKMTHETLLEAIVNPAGNASSPLTSLSIRAHEVLMTPNPLTSVLGAFSNLRGFGRGGSAQNVADELGLTPRCQLVLPRSSSIVFRAVVTAAFTLVCHGRRRWIEA